MAILVSYICVLVIFGAVDACWLPLMGPILYRPTLADILTPNVRVAPAVVFYLSYAVGVVMFAVLPGLRTAAASNVFLSALLFGAIAYGTYDLTNYATLRNWTLQITIIDIAYGALLSGIAGIAAYVLVRATIGFPSML